MVKESNYYKKHMKIEEKSRFSTILNKILISIIFLLVCLITTNFSENFRSKFKEEVLENTISFTKFNRFYEKFMTKKDKEEDELVSSDVGIDSTSYEEYNGSYKFKVGVEAPVDIIASGIIVYIGDKDGYDNTVIVQGNDGVDIWYSNVYVTDYSLYDYVKRGKILGSSINEEIIVTFMKDGKKISYEEYFG